MLDKILEGLDSVTFYNGLAEEVERWKSLEPNDFNSISAPDNVVIPKTEDDYVLSATHGLAKCSMKDIAEDAGRRLCKRE